jgi:hypothetical protein
MRKNRENRQGRPGEFEKRNSPKLNPVEMRIFPNSNRKRDHIGHSTVRTKKITVHDKENIDGSWIEAIRGATETEQQSNKERSQIKQPNQIRKSRTLMGHR